MKKEIFNKLQKIEENYVKENEIPTRVKIAEVRHFNAGKIANKCTTGIKNNKKTFTDKLDNIICNRFLGPIVLFATLFGIYELAIVQGYNLTNYWWPVLGGLQDFVESLLPAEGFLSDPFITSFILWIVQGITAVLNYIPIFLILFALVAIMEDSGYMARIAFILDRIFRPFGLHGQSALPLLLGGLYVGGCAIPGIMATRAIKDERARHATILVVPLMNCLAKIPFYVLLINIFFFQVSGLMMFLISTVTIFVALSVSKILSLTVLKKMDTSPFVMEMPPYHAPSVKNVLRRVVERIWAFLKKVVTIIALVSAVLYFLLNFPGVGKESEEVYLQQEDTIIQNYVNGVGYENPYIYFLDTPEKFANYIDFEQNYKDSVRNKSDEEIEKINKAYLMKNPEFFKIATGGKFELAETELEFFDQYNEDYSRALNIFIDETINLDVLTRTDLLREFSDSWENANQLYFSILRTGKVTISGNTLKDSLASAASKPVRTVERERKVIRKEYNDEKIEKSLMGSAGKFIEPVTKYAGFNWKVNISLLSALAAKENTVATLGSIYQSDADEGSQELSEKISQQEEGWTPLHAAAMMIFMALYPPCLAALITIGTEAGFKWMLFSVVYPTILGFLFAVLIFSGGTLLGTTGLVTFLIFYFIIIGVTILLGLYKPRLKKQKI